MRALVALLCALACWTIIPAAAASCKWGSPRDQPEHCYPPPKRQPGPPRLVFINDVPDLKGEHIAGKNIEPLSAEALSPRGAPSAPGPQKFRFTAPGYAPREVTVVVAPHDDTRFTIKLARLPKLHLVSEFEGKLTFDGKEQALHSGDQTYSIGELDTTRVKHVVSITVDNYVPWQTELEIRCENDSRGEPSCGEPVREVTFALTPKPRCVRVNMSKQMPVDANAYVGLRVFITKAEPAGGEGEVVKSGILPFEACDVPVGEYVLIGRYDSQGGGRTSGAGGKANASANRDYELLKFAVESSSDVELNARFDVNPSAALPKDWDEIVGASIQDRWACERDKLPAACTNLGYLHAHGLLREPVVGPSAEDKANGTKPSEPSKFAMTQNERALALDAYHKACELDDAEGCLGEAWLQRLAGDPAWRDKVSKICADGGSDCLYLYTREAIDPTTYASFYSRDEDTQGEFFARLGLWPLQSGPARLDIGFNLVVRPPLGIVVRPLQFYGGLGVSYRTLEQTDIDSQESNRTHAVGLLLDLGLLLRYERPTWSIGTRLGGQLVGYIGNVGVNWGLLGTLFWKGERWSLEAGTLFEQLPVKSATYKPFESEVTIGSHDWRFIPALQVAYALY